MVTEAELIEIESRGELLIEFTSDVLGVIANAILEDADYRDGLTVLDGKAEKLHRDLQRLIEECRANPGKGAVKS